MAYSIYITLFLALAVYSVSSQSTLGNVTLSPTAVEVGGSFNLSVEFVYDASSNFVSLKCGFGTESSHTSFTEYNRFERKLKLVSSSFPAAYTGRITFPSAMTMTISKVQFEEEGTNYICEYQYYDSASRTTKSVYSNNPNITAVYAQPVFGLNSLASNSDIIEGQNTTLKCNVTSRPASSIMWSYDSSNITATQSTSSVTNGYYTSVIGMLEILNVDMTMNGKKVTCMGMPVYGQSITSQTTLNVLYLPKNVALTVSPENPKQGEMMTLTCSATAKPAVNEYHFYLNDTFLGNSTNGMIMVNATKCKQFTGIYKCSASNTVGASNNATKSVAVTAPVMISPKLSSMTVNETSNVTMQCFATGCPEASVKWTKKGDNSFASHGSTLELTSVTKSNAGTYTCTADNGYTNDTSEAVLTVNYQPISTAFTTATLKPVQNSQVMINCTADSVPSAMYKFYQVTNDSETEVSSASSETSGVLTISSINFLPGSYDVTYKCVPYNMLGQGPSQSVTLNIQVPPTVTAALTPNTVNESDDTTLQCVVTAANPPANVTAIDPSSNDIALDNGTAQITNVTRGSGGNYSCKADNGVGSPVTEFAELFVNYKPVSVTLASKPVKPLNGGSVTLSCTSSARPAASYKFYRVTDSNETEISHDGSDKLTISSIDYVSVGGYKVTYKCMAFNMLGSGPAASVELDIQVPPQLSVSGNVTVNKGENASFTCTVTAANPPANVTWIDASNTQLSHSNGALTLFSVTRHNSGQYICKADNGVTGSPVTKSVTLTVQFAPENSNLTTNSLLTVQNGSSITLRCTSLAVPAAEYMFYETIGGVTKMVSSPNSKSTGVLFIANIQTDLSTYKTMYKCMPKNSLGNGTMQMLEFNVLVPPSGVVITPNTHSHTVNESDNVMMNCSVKYGNPKPSITWKSSVSSDSFSGTYISLNPVNRNNAKTYTCTATNSIANETRSIILTVQYGPEMVGSANNVTFTKCETQSVNLTCITNGIPTPDVQLKFGDNVLASGKSLVVHVIPSLAANQFGLYLCVVSNLLKKMDIARLVYKPATPGAVRSLAVKSDKGEFEVSWTAPVCKSSSGIKEYRIRHKQTGATSWEKTSTTTTSPFKITNLEDGKDYTISVAVVAESGSVGQEETKTAKATGKKAPDPGESKGNKAAMIGGIAGGCFVFLILLIILVLYCSKKRNHSQAVETGNGGVPAAYGDDTDKNKNSGIVMKDLNGDQVDHSVGPRGDLYAKVSKRGKSPNTKIDNPAIAYGAVDNENFVAESDGAYEPVDVKPAKEESPKASPANTKKAEGNYAELSSFRTPGDETEKPKPDANKTEYASIQDLGPLKPHDDNEDKPKDDAENNADEGSTKEDATPEKEDTDVRNDNAGPDADTTSSRVNLI